jgi:methionine synthase II (cobalamin-independent)
VRLTVHFACGGVGDLLDPLLDLPAAGLGLDFTDAYREPNLATLARWRGDTRLQAGVVDARSIRVETPSKIHETLAAVTARVPAEHVLAAPSTSLLHLPYHAAFEKLTALAAAAHSFGQETPR